MAKRWYLEDGERPSESARRLGRDKSTLTRLLVQRRPLLPPGRKAILTEAAVGKLEQRLEAMIRKADGKYEVTAAALKRPARCKACSRTTLGRLHKRGVYFRPLRQKPVLTPEDVVIRMTFASKYVGGGKSVAW